MKTIIYLIIVILYIVLILWSWNNTQDFESKQKRIIFIAIGTMALLLITFILFSISQIGINYTNEQIFEGTRRLSILLFTPINGYMILPQIAKNITDIKLGEMDNEKIKRRIIIQAIIIIIFFIAEVSFLKDFQNGIGNK